MSDPAPAAPQQWRTPEELVAIGFERSRVVMMNEAHHMLLRSVRTRSLGRRVLPRSVEFPGQVPHAGLWVRAYSDVLARLGGAAGFLAEDAPRGWAFPESADAFVIATDNRMS